MINCYLYFDKKISKIEINGIGKIISNDEFEYNSLLSNISEITDFKIYESHIWFIRDNIQISRLKL